LREKFIFFMEAVLTGVEFIDRLQGDGVALGI
jgi:hypothetical protein